MADTELTEAARSQAKDPSKVDRSAAYAARHIAKNLRQPAWLTACSYRWHTQSAKLARQPLHKHLRHSQSQPFGL